MIRSTLQIKRPFGRTFLLTVIIFTLLVVALETALRAPAVYLAISPKDYVLEIPMLLSTKSYQLSKYKRNRKADDCIIVGDSQALHAVDPEIVNNVYVEITGNTLLCFNFAAPGLSTYNTARLLETSLRDYQPEMIIVAYNTMDYLDDSFRDATFLSSWTDHRQKPLYEGWMLSNSYLYRLARSYGINGRPLVELTDYGFPSQLPIIVEDQEALADSSHLQDMVGLSSEVYQEDIRSLIEKIPGETLIILVPMPIYPAYVEPFIHTGPYQDFQAYFAAEVEARNGVSISLPPEVIIPSDGWEAAFHLNVNGARLYSQWLGTTLAEVLTEQAAR